jgi:hypothetical protein
MRAPLDVVQQSEELKISDRSSWSGSLADESFGLGGYRVQDVDRKWNSTRTNTLFGFEQSRTRGGYAYKLSAGGSQLEGGCSTEERQKSQDLGDGAEFSSLVAKLGCSCRDGDVETNLILDASTTNQYKGSIKGSDFSYSVTAITTRENASWESHDPLGYRVDGEGPIGAVDVVKPGRVWLNKSLEEPRRRQVACVLAGLLLYQPPRDR